METGKEKCTKSKMREGDYLRQKAELDDDDDEETPTGCFRFPKSRSSSHIVKSSRLSESHDSPTVSASSSNSRVGRIAEKGIHFFRNSHSDSAVVATKRKPAAASGSCSAQQQQQQRRRYMRIVRDENAPPPDASSDNPNTVCRYSQDYLRDYYTKKHSDAVKVAADGGCCNKPALPYTTSGHTILKKALTDPSSELLNGGNSSSAPTVGTSLKHATFNDIVTVFDSVKQTVTTEHIHDQGPSPSAADDDEKTAIEAEQLSDEKVGEFFLAAYELPVTSEPPSMTSEPSSPEVEAEALSSSEPMVTEDLTDGFGGNGAAAAVAVATSPPPPLQPPPPPPAKCEASALQHIFSPFSEPSPGLGFDSGRRQATQPQIRRVKLERLMEQARVSGETTNDDQR